MNHIELTAERLREFVRYDPPTGEFERIQEGGRVNARGGIGSIKRGYLHIGIGKRRYLAHRLAWFYVHGRWPAQQIDHINGIRLDNRIENLRDVSGLVNRQNCRRATVANRTGFLGVRFEHENTNRPFVATIEHLGKSTHVGSFASPDEAHAAYVAAKRRLHEGCTL